MASVKCPDCKGTGCVTDENDTIYDDPCETCGGEGVVDEADLPDLDPAMFHRTRLRERDFEDR